MPTVIAIANQKGGCGKTTTTHTLGVHFAEGGYRVLMIDIDPQSSLTNSCAVKDADGRSIAEVLGGAQPGTLRLPDVIRSLAPGLDLVPSHVRLSAVELQLVSRMSRELLLRELLARQLPARYDLIFIDCPPSLGLLTINALAAAHGVLSPTQPAKQDLYGLGLFINTLRSVRQINPALRLIGVVPTFYDARTLHHRSIVEQLDQSPLPVLQVIGRSIRITEAPAVGETILTFAPDNPQALAYRRLGREVEQWLESVNAR